MSASRWWWAPASTLYGANAFSGVISISTRKPIREGQRWRASLTGGGATGAPNTDPVPPLQIGAMGQGYVEYSVGWGSGGLRLSTSASYMPSFGHRGDSGEVVKEDGRIITGWVDVDQSIGKWNLRLQGNVAYKKAAIELLDAAHASQQDYIFNATLDREKIAGEDDALSVGLSVRHNRWAIAPQLSPDIGTFSFNVNSTVIDARTQYRLPVWFHNTTTFGAQARLAFIEQPQQRMQVYAGLFVEDTFTPISQLVITAGLRLDTREEPGQKFFSFASLSPRASLVWLVSENHSLVLEYGSAFRTPSAMERGGPLLTSTGLPVGVGDPALQNERVHSILLGWRGRIHWFVPRIEAFIARTTNNISSQFELRTSDSFDFQGRELYAPQNGRFKYPFYIHNVDGFWIPGAIARLGFEPSSIWRGFAQYTFYPVDSMHTVTLNQELVLPAVIISAQLIFADQWTDDATRPFDIAARLMLNARASIPLDEKKHFWLSFAGMNLVDARFFTRPARPGIEQLTGDVSTGERLGPRFWADLTYRN